MFQEQKNILFCNMGTGPDLSKLNTALMKIEADFIPYFPICAVG